ncbi:hypothetical protein [Buchnera aphidicola]|uniref:hypothetical protein n=1 Tax=Buchnera aphidicola TaxID=9 RepID=UPI003464CC57
MKVYLVGGAVRDFLLKLPVHDKDWVIVGGKSEELLSKKYKQVGKDFPVFLHPKTFEEYALARTEKKNGVGYTGFLTNYSKNITLKQDLKRRDLTINAIAQDSKGKYIDPFNGIKDLKNRLLKHVSNAFEEDPLRVLRVARFSAKLSNLGFVIYKKTLKVMKRIVDKKEILNLTSHRIWNETKKSLDTKFPHVYILELNNCFAFSTLFPEIYYLYKLNLKNIFFNFTSINTDLIFRLAKFSQKNVNFDTRFIFLCQFLVSFLDFNLDIRKKSFRLNFYSFLINKMFIRLNIPTKIKNITIMIIKYYYIFHNIFSYSSEKIIFIFNKINIWRNPNILNEISSLVNFCPYYNNFCLCKKKNFKPSEILKILFFILQSISVKFILKKGLKGVFIKKKLINLRIKLLDFYRLKTLSIEYKKNKNF